MRKIRLALRRASARSSMGGGGSIWRGELLLLEGLPDPELSLEGESLALHMASEPSLLPFSSGECTSSLL